MAEPMTKIIERCQISPAPEGSVPPTDLPLTFLDLFWCCCFPKPLFVFELPQPTHYFTLTVVPRLKHSLSAALRHFFPLSGRLVSPPEPGKPLLRFSSGDSVSFTVAVSGAEIKSLASNEPRDVTECHPFVPALPPSLSDGGEAQLVPLLAVQVTVFPGSGFTVGATLSHVACDGRAFAHFMRSWSLLCRSPPDQLTLVDPPRHDRTAVVDRHGAEAVYLKDWWAVASSNKLDTDRSQPAPENTVRATFVMGRAHIDKLKHAVLAHYGPSTLHVSTFVVTIACTWTNLVRTQKQTNETCHLCFLADCRNRSVGGSDPPIPAGYFGNCMASCFVSMKRNEMVGENGVLATAKAIAEAVIELKKEPLREAEKWGSTFMERWGSGNLVTIAGSPNMGLYDIDFGWGRPKKALATHVDASGAISLAECIDEGGGVEIGLALDKDKMSTFTALFEQTLELL